jgi:hypothetical protein
VRSLENAESYESNGESEYSRERSDPYQMVDYMIDRGLNLHEGENLSFFISDDQIRENVCELLARDPLIDASEIEVDVYKGFVILRGFVDSRQTKRLAELTVDDLPGVNDIINQLEFSTGTRYAI